MDCVLSKYSTETKIARIPAKIGNPSGDTHPQAILINDSICVESTFCGAQEFLRSTGGTRLRRPAGTLLGCPLHDTGGNAS